MQRLYLHATPLSFWLQKPLNPEHGTSEPKTYFTFFRVISIEQYINHNEIIF